MQAKSNDKKINYSYLNYFDKNAPPTHHMINCRVCKKDVLTPIQYTLRCNPCKRKQFGDSSNDSYLWQAWNNEP